MKSTLFSSFVLTLSFLFFLPGMAQDGRKYEGSGSFNIGYAQINNTDFQAFLPGDYPSIGENYFLIGGEGYGLKENFLFGMSGQALLGGKQSNGGISTKISGGMGFLHFGYTVVNQDRIKLFPMLGIGGGSMELRISEDSGVSLGDIVSDPGREVSLSVGNVILDFALGMDYLPYWEVEENGQEGGGIKTGIRIGYMLGFNNDKWEYGGGEIGGAPNFGLSSFYVKLVIGGHGFSTE